MKLLQLRKVGTIKHHFWHLGKQVGLARQMHAIRIALRRFKAFSSRKHVRWGIMDKQMDVQLFHMKISTDGINGITHSRDIDLKSPRREVVRSSAGAGVIYPPFLGSFA